MLSSQVVIEGRSVFPQELPKHLVCFPDHRHVEIVEVEYYFVVQYVTEYLEAFFRWTTVKEEHAGNIAHALHIANVLPEVLISKEDFPEGSR